MKKLVVLILLCGCSVSPFSSNSRSTNQLSEMTSLASTDTGFKSPTNVKITEAPSVVSGNDQIESAEIIWKESNPMIDGFIIRSGATPEALVAEVRVKKEEVELIPDPKLGTVFRYILKDIPHGAPVYVAIASFSAESISPFSATREVPKISTSMVNPRKGSDKALHTLR